MRALIQRVSFAQVHVNQEILAQIGPGLLVFLGVTHADTLQDAAWLAGFASRLQTGRFAADMQVALNNDGPVTILLESPVREGLVRGNG